ncbi:MAG: type II secretion system protein [Oscillospiraceae bacterium]|jgi:prepilin-type N-terminal cleavage/methylation domain-containing protein
MKQGRKLGMTLVEVIVALAIVALAMTMLVSVVAFAGSLLRKSTDLKNEGQLAAGEVDQMDDTTPGEPGSVTIYGTTISGAYHIIQQGETSFLIFVPAVAGRSE